MSALATSLLDRVHALAENAISVQVTRSADGASMVIAIENGHKMTVNAGDGGKLTMVHDDWLFTINGQAQPLDAATIVGYIDYVASIKVFCAA